jgi:predicted protein tyrosine phosphatase
MDEGYDSSGDEDYLFLPSEIIEGKLYLSCASVASRANLIELYKIKGIVSLGGIDAQLTYKMHPDQIRQLIVIVSDLENEPILLEFEGCIDFINKTEGAVLVHCMAGISRSATIVIAYLMSEKRLSFQDAYDHVKKRRRIVRPNDGFIRQLREFELQLNA